MRLDGNDYSVHPAVIGRRIEVIAGLDRVRVICDGRAVADHERIWAWHQTITDPPTTRRPKRCAGSGPVCYARLANPTSSSATWQVRLRLATTLQEHP